MSSKRKVQAKTKGTPTRSGKEGESRVHLGLVLSAVGAVVGITLTAFITPAGQLAVQHVFGSDATHPGTSGVGHLGAVDMTVTNKVAYDVGITPAELDIKVQNFGTARVVAKRAKLSVQDFLRVGKCGSEGETEVTGVYDVRVPVMMSRGDSLQFQLNQDEAPDEVDRFLIKLQQPASTVAGVSLYRLNLTIETNGTPADVDMGVLIIALPFVPDMHDNEDYWNPELASGQSDLSFLGPERGEVENCLHANSANMRKFLSLPGSRSPDLSALPAYLR
jgi:hypothetical protein